MPLFDKKISELTEGSIASDDYVPTQRGTGNFRLNLKTSITGLVTGMFTDGYNNVRLGLDAMSGSFSSANNIHNIAIGPYALASLSGTNYNIGIGHRAASELRSSAIDNIVIGRHAGSGQSSYQRSIFIGGFSAPGDSSDSNEIVIGHFATGGGTNTVTIGNGDITATYLKGSVYAPYVNANTGDYPILLNIGSRGHISETRGGLNTLIGVNLRTSQTVDNRIDGAINTSDGAAGILMTYEQGIVGMGSASSTVAGGHFYSETGKHNKLFQFYRDKSVSFGPWTGLVHPRFLIHYGTSDLCGYIQKNPLGSLDLNFDGGVMVSHDITYAGTYGYANTTQFYSLAGAQGTVLGNNSYTNNTVADYTGTLSSAQWAAKEANGNIRFELGPVWPYSEKMRINNSGDILIGRILSRKFTASQVGTIVTSTVNNFASTDPGKFVCWGDWENGGSGAYVDRITGYIDSTHVGVERSRFIASQAMGVYDFKHQLAARAGTMTASYRMADDWYLAGGDGITTKPFLHIEPTGAQSYAWSTLGTVLGMNARPGFLGNFIDAQTDATSLFRVGPGGSVFANGDVTVSASAGFYILGRAYLNSSSLGVATLSDGAEGTGMQLNLAGTTDAFPSIVRRGSGIHIRTAAGASSGPIWASSGVFNAPVIFPSYFVSALPSAGSHSGGMVYVSNEAGGAVMAFSDGLAWRRLTDRNIVS